jgi:hypothetical protein
MMGVTADRAMAGFWAVVVDARRSVGAVIAISRYCGQKLLAG